MRNFDPFGSMQNMMGQLQQFRGNPMQFMAQRKLNIPQTFANNPQGAIQHLLNSGQLSQDQYNTVSQMAQQLRNSPQFQSFFRNR